jgi:DNA-binding transcriptional ArsR family regulator
VKPPEARIHTEIATLARALADPSRVTALSALAGRELCVCQLTELLALAPSTVSKHLAVLRQAGLVTSRKDGRWVYYRRVSGGGSGATRATLAWLDALIDESPDRGQQAERLDRVLAIPLETLCAREGEEVRR